MKRRALFTVVVAGLAWSTAATCLAAPITQDNLFGAVPEPASLVLLGGGLLGIAKFRRRSVQR